MVTTYPWHSTTAKLNFKIPKFRIQVFSEKFSLHDFTTKKKEKDSNKDTFRFTLVSVHSTALVSHCCISLTELSGNRRSRLARFLESKNKKYARGEFSSLGAPKVFFSNSTAQRSRSINAAKKARLLNSSS